MFTFRKPKNPLRTNFGNFAQKGFSKWSVLFTYVVNNCLHQNFFQNRVVLHIQFFTVIAYYLIMLRSVE